ncbi:hypothetical protein [Thauera linaloolentis]|uniref:hypothetical protein n=1 Tax=Thauera linaloolentis TaxID=76112 RepID=UPI0012B630B2|nr:hypothetical protein [Thauera linaloolentis]MCM8566977.1 hypothetical protein [Thauera linaloolentis]
MKMQELYYLDKNGQTIGPMLTDSGKIKLITQNQPAPRGATWTLGAKTITIMFDQWIDLYPTPLLDGLVVLYPRGSPEPYVHPDNAAIHNANGSFRCHLKAPKPLSKHLPGYVHTPEQVAKLPTEGFWQVGWGCGDGIRDFSRPWMWANIGLHCDIYERRYFDPDTGKFDLEHFHTGRY